MKRILVLAALAAVLAGCASFVEMQSARFINDDGEFLTVIYGTGKEEHHSTFVSPGNGKRLDYSSKLRVKVTLPDGTKIFAFQIMNKVRNGTMYATDDEEWLYLANGFTCQVYRRTERPDGVEDYLLVYEGALSQTPRKPGEVGR